MRRISDVFVRQVDLIKVALYAGARGSLVNKRHSPCDHKIVYACHMILHYLVRLVAFLSLNGWLITILIPKPQALQGTNHDTHEALYKVRETPEGSEEGTSDEWGHHGYTLSFNLVE